MTDMSETQLKMLTEMEEMVMDTFNRMRLSCTSKCTNKRYDQPEVVKSEGVCIDRCVAKFMGFHDMIGKRLARDKDTYSMLAQGPPLLKTDKNKT